MNEKEPIKRSYVGGKQHYEAFAETLLIQKERQRRNTMLANKKKKKASKVVVLRQKLSSRLSSHLGPTDSNPLNLTAEFKNSPSKEEHGDEFNDRSPKSEDQQHMQINAGYEIAFPEPPKDNQKINLCVPAINTETLNNLELN